MNNTTPNQFPPVAMKTGQAARYLGLSRRHLHTLTAQGRLPFVRIGPRCHLFKRSDLDQFLDRFTVKARGAA
ncbi:MAG: DNA-binding protein [Verrucomicrobia bacterium]|nr:MAG: DNA-binding protein [Verrucomicrobiota bacterium]